MTQASDKKQVQNRLKRLEGQVRGLQKMVDKDKYCVDIINQSSAVRSALSSVEDVLLENHLSEHVIHQMKGNQEKKATAEIVEIFKRAKRK
ncbi:MAG: metal-sensitive transcriptional regulator [Patescibacteria group bacterium]|nr:metal-sensitive transcriptional regulator [Patescibacteria group bacterium]